MNNSSVNNSITALILVISIISCTPQSGTFTSTSPQQAMTPNARLDVHAESFVRLALSLGVHDADYVDAYHGKPEWRDAAQEQSLTLGQIQELAKGHLNRLRAMRTSNDMSGKRRAFLIKQFSSLQTRAAILSGVKLSFDQESEALYDAIAPTHGKAYFERVLVQLDRALPGQGALGDRVKAFRDSFIIPSDRLDQVFKAAIAECRRRTIEHIELPANEKFVVEYVTGKSWSGYNWFQGDAYSVIQVNTDFPIVIDRAIDLACHEGYPGHHVYNTLLEKNLLKEKGWQEFAVFPLFSPTGLIAEGSANYGVDLAFPGEERLAFERAVLFPMAGLDASRVKEYYDTEALLSQLDYAGNDTARRFLDAQINADQAAAELERYALMTPERAQQRVKFIEKYRSYVINYNLGRDIVIKWVEQGTTTQTQRWQKFERLLSEPMLPSQLGEQ